MPPPLPTTRVAIVAFDGFNELDAFIALGLLNRLGAAGWKAELTGPTARLTSMHGVTLDAQQPLEFANDADIVLFAGGLYTRGVAENSAIVDRLALDPVRQLIGGQCSGVLMLARLGLLADMPACTDAVTKPWLIEAGVRVDDAAFHARGPVATAGGNFSALYLAAWLMTRRAGREAALQVLQQTAPVGDAAHVERVMKVVEPFI